MGVSAASPVSSVSEVHEKHRADEQEPEPVGDEEVEHDDLLCVWVPMRPTIGRLGVRQRRGSIKIR
jgi:hypothetical protein